MIPHCVDMRLGLQARFPDERYNLALVLSFVPSTSSTSIRSDADWDHYRHAVKPHWGIVKLLAWPL